MTTGLTRIACIIATFPLLAWPSFSAAKGDSQTTTSTRLWRGEIVRRTSSDGERTKRPKSGNRGHGASSPPADEPVEPTVIVPSEPVIDEPVEPPDVNQTPNTAPTISGSPPASVNAGQSYYFAAVANDADGDVLNFAINNLPPWASFDATTGEISGTPAALDAGSYNNIVISVSDNMRRAYLPAFSVQVVASNQTPTTPGSATLSWSPPTQNDDGSPLNNLSGYVVEWGTSTGNYSSGSVTLANPGLTSFVVGNLTAGATYFFAVKAFNQDGTQSVFSNEASKSIP